jgi:hypothetical protein
MITPRYQAFSHSLINLSTDPGYASSTDHVASLIIVIIMTPRYVESARRAGCVSIPRNRLSIRSVIGTAHGCENELADARARARASFSLLFFFSFFSPFFLGSVCVVRYVTLRVSILPCIKLMFNGH